MTNSSSSCRDTLCLCRNKAMRAAAFSADGSVLAVAADTVITLWDPYNNVLVAVLGETPMVIFVNPGCPYDYCRCYASSY